MKFKLDENLPEDLTTVFADAGHDVSTVLMQGLKGEQDSRIIEICGEEQRVLVTADSDFSDIRVYPPEKYYGIIFLRLEVQSRMRINKVVQKLLPHLERELLVGCLWSVDETSIRIRSLNEGFPKLTL